MSSKKISDLCELMEKLEKLDDRILNLWLDEDVTVSDDERWDLFVLLLETRVNLLKTCRDARIPLTPDQIVPRWLARLTNSRCEMKKRELRHYDEERKMRRNIGIYESVAKVDAAMEEGQP